MLHLLQAVRPDACCAAQVAPRTHARETNVIGQPVGGPALLQLWEVPRPSSGGGGAGDGANRGLPRMALGLAFPDGGVVWEVKWCPSAACGLPAADGCLPRCVSCRGLSNGSGHVCIQQVTLYQVHMHGGVPSAFCNGVAVPHSRLFPRFA